jgi:outer membrane lipoprotein carrier protein
MFAVAVSCLLLCIKEILRDLCVLRGEKCFVFLPAYPCAGACRRRANLEEFLSERHWDYDKPYVQLIVGDGKKVWLFDPDLNQVTVRPLDKVLGSSPAALLAGSKDIDKTFELKSVGKQGELNWVEAIPKEKESGFDKVMLGFKGNMLQEMEMRDSFGQITVIEFSKQELNPRLNEKSFRFVPPQGADVLSE